jgi:hypothetical protein
MELKQNPFSIYDFLGYFIPGATTILLLDKFPHHKFLDVTNITTPKSAEEYLPFILSAYLLGHIVGYLSSISIERYSNWRYGYPSKFLLGFPVPKYIPKSITKSETALRLTIGFFMLPIVALDITIGKIFQLKQHYAKKLDPLLQQVLKRKIFNLLIEHGQESNPADHGSAENTDFFRYVYHFSLENAPAHTEKMTNYVALYGFLRANCFIFNCISWIIIIHICIEYSSPIAVREITQLATIMIAGYILFMGFMKFYTRYTLDALMAMAVTYKYTPPSKPHMPKRDHNG